MINVQLMNDEIYINCQNYADKVAGLIKDHPDSSDWMIAFGNGKPFDETNFQIEDFEVFMPSSKEDYDSIIKTAISMHKALKALPGHVLGDVRFWAWLTFTKMYKFLNAIASPTKELIQTNIVPKYIAARRMNMLQIIGRYYFMCDLSFSEDNENPYYLTGFLVKRIELYRSLVYRNFSDIPAVPRSVVIAEKEYEEKHPGQVVTVDDTRLLMKEITNLGSVRLVDVIPEKELLKIVKEKLETIMTTK